MRPLPFAALLALAPAAAAAAPVEEETRFGYLVDEYLRGWAAAHPTEATDLGLHEHDGDLDDLSVPAVRHEVRRLRRFASQLDAVDGRKLSGERADELAMLKSRIAADLITYEGVQPHRRRADFYAGLASESIYVLIKRDFAPAVARLASVCAREERIPALLADGRSNLERVAKVNIGIALEELPGIESFFRDDVPAAFASLRKSPGAADPALLARFDKANGAVLRALADWRAFVDKKLATRAVDEFAIGEQLYRDKLRAEEMVDEPLDALLARGEAELHRLQREFQATAAKIDPKRPFRDVQRELTADHPTADHLLAETSARLDGLRRFVAERGIATLPLDEKPKVEETPPFMRAITMASMSTPGPFETRARESMYNVTLPDPGWAKERAEDFLRGAFNRPLMDVVSIHEAFPGHFVQFLWSRKLESKLRRFVHAHSNSEGWAHYCEQMMLDEGWGGGDPKVRLAQLQDALLRAARYVVGIRLHARGMTFDEAKRFFVDEGYQSPEVAAMEAKRGTVDPTYLVYTLGKLEILRLRDDYRAKLGAAYSLRRFHDAFLAQGAIPLPLVRKALLAAP
jgi:uncharacterized protein (DUF885 family)